MKTPQNKTKWLSLLLAFGILTSGLLVGCAGKKDRQNETGPDTGAVTADTAAGKESKDTETAGKDTGAETEPEEEMYADLPKGSYDGYTFTMLQYEDRGAVFTVPMHEEEDDGTIIVSDLYEAGLAVEDRLGVDLNSVLLVTTDEVFNKVNEDILSGDGNYDLVSDHSSFSAAMMTADMLVPFDDIEEVNLSNPWWNSTVTGSVSFSKTYLAYGYINLSVLDGATVTLFNKDIVADNRYGDLYQTVLDGKWTLDEYIRLARDYAAKGEGFYGGAGYPYTGCAALIYACDTDILDRDNMGNITYSKLSDKLLEVYNKVFDTVSDSAVFYRIYDYLDMFKGGQTLFVNAHVSALRYYRADNVEYGLLPLPKYNDAQDGYITYITNQVQPVTVTTINKGLENGRTGTVIENYCAEVYRHTKDDYAKYLNSIKILRDTESIDMLNLVLESRSVLPIYGIFSIGTAPYLGSIFGLEGDNNGIASRLAAVEGGIQESLDNLVNKY